MWWAWIPGTLGWLFGMVIGFLSMRSALRVAVKRLNECACFYPNRPCLKVQEAAADIAATMKEDGEGECSDGQ